MKKMTDNSDNQQPSETNADTPIQQLRKNISAQVNGLKKSVLAIQQESLRDMHSTIHNIFKILSTDNMEQLSNQDKEVKQQLDQVMQEADVLTAKSSFQLNLAAAKNSLPAQTYHDAATQAMEFAQASVQNAIASAEGSIEKAEKILTNMDGKK